MLAIAPPPSKRQKLTPNLLPCTIKHNGPIPTSKRHWCPITDAGNDRTLTSYFRGRKLRGRTVKLPEGYTGVVLQKTEKSLESKRTTAPALPVPEIEQEDEEDEYAMKDGGEDEEVKLMEQQGTFDEVVCWGHEAEPEDEDEYVKGIDEWIAFAKAVCCSTRNKTMLSY
ncbi:ribonuclease H1 small subunit [Teratosphaeria destructans]|uniref:Ribonuclease H1 small subunit n=1 Tax=Teratosphaeria destructans TaxID=418781 RepID=A0A9W7SSZ0_9PEZI|nr:ribonuclease H1 small subunit [Teratosphaeria destructans]